MEITGETKNQFSEIIKEKEIKTLFQPIVNLKNGTIFGYGTTNRITLKKFMFGISEAHEIARKTKRLLDFEILCRKNTVKSAAGKPQNTKLFINFDPNVIREDGYKVGVTMEKLEKNELDKPRFASSCRSTVGELCSKKPVISPNALFMEVYEIMNDPNVTEIAIVDGGGLLLGVLNRRQVLNALGGMYGYTLNMRKTGKNVMDTSCLTVSGDTPIETAAKMAMSRPQQSIYDSMPVVNGTTNQYLGFVSIKDLLLTAVNIQVSRAKNCNPLTELPGNIEIDERVERLIGNDEPFAIIYFDLDNFKAYNDAYGFANGDMMIKAVAETLTEYCREEDFCGHVGGDDFVVITAGDRAESFCGEAFARFAERCLELYSESDRERVYIVSRNRSGAVENFPLASLSAAAITNRERSFTLPEELSLIIAKTKKLAKQKTGNSLVIV